MDQNTKPSEVLLMAAEMCLTQAAPDGDPYYGCNAISVALGGRNKTSGPSISEPPNTPYKRHKGADSYLKLLKPMKGDTYADVYFRTPRLGPNGRGYFGPPYEQGCQKHRILALCMAAAIAKSEGN